MPILIFYFFFAYIFPFIANEYIINASIYNSNVLHLNDYLYLFLYVLIFLVVFICRKKLMIKFQLKEVFVKKKIINNFLIFIFINSFLFYINDFSSYRYEAYKNFYIIYFELIIIFKYLLTFFLLFLSNYEIKIKYLIILIISFIFFINGLQASLTTLFVLLAFILRKKNFSLKKFTLDFFTKKNLFTTISLLIIIPFFFSLGIKAKNKEIEMQNLTKFYKTYFDTEYLIVRLSDHYYTVKNLLKNEQRYFPGNINSQSNKIITKHHLHSKSINNFNSYNLVDENNLTKFDFYRMKDGSSTGFIGSFLILFDKKVSLFLFLLILILYFNVIENIFLGSKYSLKNIFIILFSYNIIFRGIMSPVDILNIFDTGHFLIFGLLILSTTRFLVKTN